MTPEHLATLSVEELRSMKDLNERLLLATRHVSDFNTIGEDIRTINHELSRREHQQQSQTTEE